MAAHWADPDAAPPSGGVRGWAVAWRRALGWWYLRPDPRGRVVSPLLREGQRVKLCSLLSKCPLSCLLPCFPPLGTTALGARRPEEAGAGNYSFRCQRPTAPHGAPGTEGGSRATPEAPTPPPMARPARALPVPSAAGPVLSLLSGVGVGGGLGKNASSDPRGAGMGLRVRGLRSSELLAVGGTVAPGLSGLLGLLAAWAGKVERRL